MLETLEERANWLADKIPAYGDYAKEAAFVLRQLAEENSRLRLRLEHCDEQSRRLGETLKKSERMRETLRRIAESDPPFWNINMTLDEAMARAASDAL